MSNTIKEKTKKRHSVYQGRILDLYVDDVIVPGGGIHKREVVAHGPAVAIVPVINKKSVLLIRQYRYAVDKTCWEIPAGLIDEGETSLQAARRECMEETGYYPKGLKSLGWFFSSPGFSKEKIHIYLAAELERKGGQKLDEDEFLTVREVSVSKVKQMLEGNTIKDGKTILGLMLAFKQLGIIKS